MFIIRLGCLSGKHKGDKFLKKLWCCVGGEYYIRNLVLSTELIMSIGHRIEIRTLTFRALALRQSESILSDEGLTLEMSASDSLYDGQFTLSTQLIKPNHL